MKNSPDTDYLKKVRKKINRLLKKSSKKYEDEDYHKLRVEIKKLKALAGFIGFSDKKFSKNEFIKPFAKVYKQAGKIRELQLEEAFLKKKNVQFIEQYLAGLNKAIKKEKKKFKSLVTKKVRKRTSRAIKKIGPALQESSEIDVIQFINNEKNKIARLTKELPVDTQNAHALRKILKEDFYNRKRINWPSEKIQAEDDLLELLGKWHDCVVLNEQIGTSILKPTIKPAELRELLKINAQVSSQSEKLFGEINSKLAKGAL